MNYGFNVLSLWSVAIVVLLADARQATAQTWVQWRSAEGGNDHYYALTPVATNWVAAEDLAVAWRGTLATITSTNEQHFINSTFLTGALEHLPVWIGLVDTATNGTVSGALLTVKGLMGLEQKGRFKWVTGEMLSYSNWKEGEPNGTLGLEPYGTINWEYSDSPPRGSKGDWNDTPLNGTTRYGGKTTGPYFGLVERDPSPKKISKQGFSPLAKRLGLTALFVAALALGFTRYRRRRASAS